MEMRGVTRVTEVPGGAEGIVAARTAGVADGDTLFTALYADSRRG